LDRATRRDSKRATFLYCFGRYSVLAWVPVIIV
jgi:hypothetical protein